MDKEIIPEVVVARLPVYAQKLNQFLQEGRAIVSSNELAEQLGITASQIRKDLSYFGGFGKQGSGYDVITLLENLREILNLTHPWKVVLVGVGHLGSALLSYQGFARKGFEIALALDNNPELIGKVISGVEVRPVEQLEEWVKAEGVRLAIITVPASEAQSVADRLTEVGIRAILNYAPVTLKCPDGVHVSDIDPVLILQKMTFYLE
mgnify:CR=1 FL=1|jgi:redox-sensing transcriptional repressor